MLKKLIFVTIYRSRYLYQANAAEVIFYGSFNYKLSNDENSSGKSYSKLEDNGSSIGVEVIDLGVQKVIQLQVLHYLKLVLTLTIVDQILLILNLHM